MNNEELKKKVRSSVDCQSRQRGFATPVDVLIDISVLPKQKYEDWRLGRVDFLERVCTVNLNKLSIIMRELRSYAHASGLKPSLCFYKQWGGKRKAGQGGQGATALRFSKSGSPEIEKAYATHFVDTKRIEELKTQRTADSSD